MLRLRRVRAGSVFHRIHRKTLSPLFFGPAGALPLQRYDDPAGGYKTLYLALDLETAFGETLVRVPTVTDVLASDVALRARSELVARRALGLYPLVDAGVSAHGLSFTELHGADYRRTQALAAEIHRGRGARGARAPGLRSLLREAVQRFVLRARLGDEEGVLALGAADAHALLGNAGLVELKARSALLARDDHAQGSFVR